MYLRVCVAINWDMHNLVGAALLKEADSSPPSNHQLPIAPPQSKLGLSLACPWSCECSSASWSSQVHVRGGTVLFSKHVIAWMETS